MADSKIMGGVGAGIGALATALIMSASGDKKQDDTQYIGSHLLAPDYGVVSMNAGKQIELKAGQRYIQIGMVLDSGKVIHAFADTLDTDTDIGIIGKFTQCRR
jgi:hypothetical protein